MAGSDKVCGCVTWGHGLGPVLKTPISLPPFWCLFCSALPTLAEAQCRAGVSSTRGHGAACVVTASCPAKSILPMSSQGLFEWK